MVEGDVCDAMLYCRVRDGSSSTYSCEGPSSNPHCQLQDNVEASDTGQPAGETGSSNSSKEDSQVKGATEDGLLPEDLPSIVEIRRALPSHIFQPSTATSLFYAAWDVLQVAVTFFLAEWVWCSCLLPSWGLLMLLPLYWMLQGTFFTALFVVGHDAGHSSFSTRDWLNDVVGTVLHTFLLCPYYCWKLSHRRHHKNTGNIDRDEVFYPIRQQKTPKQQGRSEYRSWILPGFGLGVGWFGYLLVGYGPRPINHFNPWHPSLHRHACACLLSVCLVASWAVALWHYAAMAGFLRFFVHYLVPEFIFASYAVIITFLHHSEIGVPWYGDQAWGNVRGQLSSVDRHYGWCHTLLHSIGTHQIHHLFPKVPHYNLEEATAIFRQCFPQLVRIRSEHILPAFARMFRTYLAQKSVPHDAQIHIYT